MRQIGIVLLSVASFALHAQNANQIHGKAVIVISQGHEVEAKSVPITLFAVDRSVTPVKRSYYKPYSTKPDGAIEIASVPVGDYDLRLETQDHLYGAWFPANVTTSAATEVTPYGPVKLTSQTATQISARQGPTRILLASLSPQLAPVGPPPGDRPAPQPASQRSKNSTLPLSGPCQSPLKAGFITGQIVRMQGQEAAPIGGAVVSLLPSNPDSHPITQRSTDKGCYASEVPPGSSTLFVDAEGFRSVAVPLLRNGDSIQAFLPASVPNLATIQLQPDPGAQRSSVLQLDNSGRNYSFPAGFLLSLPLAGMRNVDRLAFLLPGVALPPAPIGIPGPGMAPGTGTAGPYSFNGLRSRNVNFTADGGDQNDEVFGGRRQSFLVPFPQPVETVEEAQYITALADARYGRSLGGQVNVLSRTATKLLHSELYGFETGDWLRARGFYEFPDVAGGRSFERSQTGAVLSGPLLGRTLGTLIYLGYEYRQESVSEQKHYAVPTLGERRVTPALLPDGASYQSSPEGYAVFSLYPLPNNPGGPYGAHTYTEQVLAGGHASLGSVKIDRDFARGGWSHRATVRYGITDETNTLASVDNALGMSLRPHSRTDSLTSFFNSGRGLLLNTARFSFGSTQTSFGEERRSDYLASSLFPGAPFLLNAPLSVVSSNRVFGVSDRSVQQLLQTNGVCSSPSACTSVNSESLTGPIGQLQIAGFSPVGVDDFHFPQSRADRTVQFGDTLTRHSDRRTYYAGIEVRGIHLGNTAQRNARPSILFGGLMATPQNGPSSAPPALPSYDPLTLAALGLPASVLQTLAMTIPTGQSLVEPDFTLELHRFQYEGFFHEYLHLKPNLEVNFGIRLGYVGFPTDVTPFFTDAFNTTQLLADAANAQSSCAGAFANRCGGLVAALKAAFPSDYQKVFGQNQWLADPRVGLAWQPGFFHRLTIRAGWGIYTDQFPAVILTESETPYPDFLSVNVASSPSNAFLVNLPSPRINCPSTPFGGTCASAPILAPGSFNVANRNAAKGTTLTTPAFLGEQLGFADPGLTTVQPAAGLRNPRSYQQGLFAEVAVTADTSVRLGYLGTLGHYLLRESTPFGGPARGALQATADAILVGGAPQLRATLISAQDVSNTSFTVGKTVLGTSSDSSYHSLQADIARRRGVLQGGFAFTYSHAIDNASDYFNLAGAYALPQNSATPSERGSSNFDSRIAATGYFLLAAPAVLHPWLRHWQLVGMYSYRSGQPFTVNTVYDVNMDGNLTDRLDSTAGLFRGSFNSDPSVSLTLVGPTAQMLAVTGTNGRVGRNTFNAAATQDLDAALFRTFYLAESVSTTLRFEAFNIANHANFGIPVRLLEAVGFGKATTTLTPARQLQIAVRFSF